MRRSLVAALCAVAGLLVGGGATLVVQGSPPPTTTTAIVPGATTTSPSAGPEATPATTAATTTAPLPEPPPGAEVLLVWTPGRLPAGFADDVSHLAGVEAVTSVRSDIAHLVATVDELGRRVDAPAEGLVIPVEVMAFEPASYPGFVPAEVGHLFSTPDRDAALLGETSARIRGLGPGAVLRFEGGTELTVTAVVDDAVIGGAEVAVAASSVSSDDIERERYLLVRYMGDRTRIEGEIRGILPEETPVRVRGPGETPVFRHGDAVLPQSIVKDRFGEFALRPGGGLEFEIDPGWVEDNIVTADVPILGEIRCHRSIVPMVAGAMADLEDRELSHLVDPGTYRGCYTPRYIAGGKGLSRHAWGIALDINWGANPTGLASAQDPRLLETMERWGFGSGHEWLLPDPGHFEWVTDAVA